MINRDNVVVHQTYQTDVNLEHVIRGNSAVLKCSVPSFIADFVTVDTWLIDDNHVVHGDSFGKKEQSPPPSPLSLSLHENGAPLFEKYLKQNRRAHAINVTHLGRRVFDFFLLVFVVAFVVVVH